MCRITQESPLPFGTLKCFKCILCRHGLPAARSPHWAEVSRAHKHDYWSQKVKEGHGTQACGTPLWTIFRFVGWKKFSPLKNTNLASSEKPHFLSPAKNCLFQSPAKARLFETKQSQTLKNKTKKRERSRCPKCKNI